MYIYIHIVLLNGYVPYSFSASRMSDLCHLWPRILGFDQGTCFIEQTPEKVDRGCCAFLKREYGLCSLSPYAVKDLFTDEFTLSITLHW